MFGAPNLASVACIKKRQASGVAKTADRFEPRVLAEVENFMHDPAGWSLAHGGAAHAAE
jgi:orotate phosphoribosyltransferase